MHANSVNLRFTDSGYTVHYKVYRFTTKSAVRWEARILPTDNTSAPQHITFTKFRPLGQEKEETAVEWPDPRVDKLVMVQKYTDIPEDVTDMIPVILFSRPSFSSGFSLINEFNPPSWIDPHQQLQCLLAFFCPSPSCASPGSCL